jgi:predicted MFS family arabinose efflux permease
MAPVSTVFSKGRGMAIALTISGASVSAALSPPIAEYFIQHYSWRMAFVALGIIWSGLLLPLVFAFVPGKRAMQVKTDAAHAAAGTGNSPANVGGFTPRKGFRSRNFWLIFLAALISGLTGLALLLNLVPVLTFTGISRADAVMIAGIMGVASLFGRLIGGWLMDNFEVRRLAAGAAVASLLFPLTLVIAPGVVWAAMGALIVHGLLGGLKMSAIVYLTSTHMGARSFGLFYGTISTTTTVAMGVGPLIANYIYDLTESYTPTIWAAIPGFLLTAVCFAALGPAPDFNRPLLNRDRDRRSAEE